MDWVNFNTPHLLPAMNWALSYQNLQKDNIDIDPDLLRFKPQREERQDNASSSTLVSSSPEDFAFEIE